MLFPTAPSAGQATTRLALSDAVAAAELPAVTWLGSTDEVTANGWDSPSAGPQAYLLTEHRRTAFGRPGVRGHRLGEENQQVPSAGRDWSPFFVLTDDPLVTDTTAVYTAVDETSGLGLRTQIEALVGGSLRIRHTLTNLGSTPYVVDGLEVSVPLADRWTEYLDFTGRHEHERAPQRHTIADGTWLKEIRRGKPGFEGSLLVAGTPGFGFGTGEVIAVQVAWSGNSLLAVERTVEGVAVVHGGESLLPGEVVLAPGAEYSSPWVVVTASGDGLDGVAASLHTWQRGLSTHPGTQPVTLNVWEAVYMDHDQVALFDIAERAARIGIERFVLDDGWFHDRRDDDAGLGDWWVDPAVWPEGLSPLVQHVHGLGMEFGLWFEPEMVNVDSDLYRAHPEWVLQPAGRLPLEWRNQHVLDLTNPDAFAHVLDAMTAVLAEYPIDYVKWDHNRDLLEAGSHMRGHAPAAHLQTEAFYRLLDTLRSRFPVVAWESCASGGGRIDAAVVEHVQRFWTSDMTDALSRQDIQRWSVQTVAPEYLGAHVSAPTSHQSGRTFSMAFRAGTAVFNGFGVEWDIRQASPADLAELADWIAWHKEHREFLHSGRTVRLDVSDPAVLAHGVVGPDAGRAVVSHVQLAESRHNRGLYLCVPGLDPSADYALSWTSPAEPHGTREPLDSRGPTGGVALSGAVLGARGFWMPRCRPETVRLVDITRLG